jgi:hypothetical protein
MKIARPICASGILASLRARHLIVLLAIVVSTNAYAVFRPPFPGRARPPSDGHWIVMGNDSIGAWPRANTPASPVNAAHSPE